VQRRLMLRYDGDRECKHQGDLRACGCAARFPYVCEALSFNVTSDGAVSARAQPAHFIEQAFLQVQKLSRFPRSEAWTLTIFLNVFSHLIMTGLSTGEIGKEQHRTPPDNSRNPLLLPSNSNC
jgi:hypothetical protein